MGDLNAVPNSEVIEAVKTTLSDCRTLSVQTPFGPLGTFNGFKFNEPVTKCIDYVFMAPASGWKVQKHAVLSDSKDLRYPSDHLPVYVELKIGRKSKNQVATEAPVHMWITSADKTSLLRSETLSFSKKMQPNLPVIEINNAQIFQTVDGFGYTLTGGSASLINSMPAAEKAALLQDLFGQSGAAIGVSYLRISMGASDLDASVFSYNDLPEGQIDPRLEHFSIEKDLIHLIPILKAIMAIRPNIKIMATPWSPPVWMKTNENSMGGNLKPEYYGVYAQYFVQYIQAMKAQGIAIEAVTVQNEPQHGGNNPSLVMSAAQQADFVKHHLGPAFQAAGIAAKIIVWDHNCDKPNYPIAILDDPEAKPFVAGAAFHLYAGDIEALSVVHDKHPDKDVYFTEQWTGSTGQFDGDFKWHIKHVMIGSMRNWSRTALEWNMANDTVFGPHTPGGCTQCRGALTIDGAKATKNVSYYIIAQMSKFVPSGSVRMGSNMLPQLPNVAFRTPEGKKVLVVLNEGNAIATFNIHYENQWITASVLPNSAATLVW